MKINYLKYIQILISNKENFEIFLYDSKTY